MLSFCDAPPSHHRKKGTILTTHYHSRKRMRCVRGGTRCVCGWEWGLYSEARRTSQSDEFIISNRLLYRNDYTDSVESSLTSWEHHQLQTSLPHRIRCEDRCQWIIPMPSLLPLPKSLLGFLTTRICCICKRSRMFSCYLYSVINSSSDLSVIK